MLESDAFFFAATVTSFQRIIKVPNVTQAHLTNPLELLGALDVISKSLLQISLYLLRQSRMNDAFLVTYAKERSFRPSNEGQILPHYLRI